VVHAEIVKFGFGQSGSTNQPIVSMQPFPDLLLQSGIRPVGNQNEFDPIPRDVLLIFPAGQEVSDLSSVVSILASTREKKLRSYQNVRGWSRKPLPIRTAGRPEERAA
jgi:hypothetical protein